MEGSHGGLQWKGGLGKDAPCHHSYWRNMEDCARMVRCQLLLGKGVEEVSDIVMEENVLCIG